MEIVSQFARAVQGGALKMLCVYTLVGSNPTVGILKYSYSNSKTYNHFKITTPVQFRRVRFSKTGGPG